MSFDYIIKKYQYKPLLLFIFFLWLIINSNKNNIKHKKVINSKISYQSNLTDTKITKSKVSDFDECYIPIDNSNLKIIHFIITRFLFEFHVDKEFRKNIYGEKYIRNGYRVIKKYLITSLENQSCKDFSLLLTLGNKADIEYVKKIMNFKCSFYYRIIYIKDLKKIVEKLSNGYDVLITTRIDYDDIIYYDAVNDIRKSINTEKPILLHGYNRGLYYFESNGKFYENYRRNGEKGALGLFLSLIVFLNKINTTITIYDIGAHTHVRYNLIKMYKSLGIKELNYEPSVFDSGAYKYIYIRQKYSVSYNNTRDIMKKKPILNINFNKFYRK